nr:hypothetical protein [Campylobacter sp.]
MQKIVFVVVAVLVAGFLLTRPNSPKSICDLKGSNIITIGDSVANGFGVSPNDTFAFKVAKNFGKNAVKLGIDGEISAELLGRIDSELNKFNNISAILISIGGNDILRKIPQNTTQNNLTQIIQKAKNYSTCVVVLGVPDKPLGLVADFYEDIASEQKIILDTSMGKILRSGSLKVDQIHPNAQGHEIITQNISNLIKKAK